MFKYDPHVYTSCMRWKISVLFTIIHNAVTRDRDEQVTLLLFLSQCVSKHFNLAQWISQLQVKHCLNILNRLIKLVYRG